MLTYYKPENLLVDKAVQILGHTMQTIEDAWEVYKDTASSDEDHTEAALLLHTEMWNEMYENACSKRDTGVYELCMYNIGVSNDCFLCDLWDYTDGVCTSCCLNTAYGMPCFADSSPFRRRDKEFSSPELRHRATLEIACAADFA